MFAGVVNRQIFFSCHPVLVLCPVGVAAAFATLEAAQRFLAGRGFRAGLIYRHDGSDWYKVGFPAPGGERAAELPPLPGDSETSEPEADFR